MQDHTRGEVVPVPRRQIRRRRIAATAAIVGAVAFTGTLDFHKAYDHATPNRGADRSALLDNVRSAPRPAARYQAKARTTEPTDDGLGEDVETLTAALALVVLAASQLPKGSPARRKLAEDALRLRLALVDALHAT